MSGSDVNGPNGKYNNESNWKIGIIMMDLGRIPPQ